MTDKELLLLAVRMRKAQREYFAARRNGLPPASLLLTSKDLESEFDKAAADRFSLHGSLV